MSRYSRRPSHFSNNQPKGNTYSMKDMKNHQVSTIEKRRTAGVMTHHDPNDKRPHTLHKVHYTHRGQKKVGFFKRVYASTRELYQHHLENKEKRSRIHETEAQAALGNAEARKRISEGKAVEIQASGEAKQKVLLGKAERTRARGEATERAEKGFKEVEVGAGTVIGKTGEAIGKLFSPQINVNESDKKEKEESQ